MGLWDAKSSSNDGGCARLAGWMVCSASDFLRKAGGCNFLVANPTNQLFTAFHRDVISYKPTACSYLICRFKREEQRQVCTRSANLIIELALGCKDEDEDDQRLGLPHPLTFLTELIELIVTRLVG